MVANILKYGSVDLVILYCCAYFGLWGTIEVVIQNSMELMKTAGFGPIRNAGFGFWVD